MLAKIRYRLEFDQDKKINMHYAQFLHGFIMENIDCEYANRLHQSGFKPFSQYLYKADGSWIWEINTLNRQAYQQIAQKVFKAEDKQIFLKKHQINIKAFKIEKDYITDYNELTKKVYLENNPKRHINIYFKTPCSFKAAGEYHIIPKISFAYTNLINRFNEYADTITLEDEQVINHLIEHTKIHSYKLKSCKFYIGKAYVKSFIGQLTLSVSGSYTLVSLANLIFEFANYSGIGIKTALGMGGVEVG